MNQSLWPTHLNARTSVRTEIINALRAALITGQMKPGEVYSAPSLASLFGVSPTPVREAMMALAKEGLVRTVPNKGFRVREMSNRELDEIAEIRLLLEIPATIQAASLATASDLSELRTIARRIVTSGNERNMIGYVEADREFHLKMLSVGHNSQLVSLVAEFRTRSRMFGLQALADTGELYSSAVEHLQMLDLMEARDMAALRNLMRTHIGHTRGSWAGLPEHEQGELAATGTSPGSGGPFGAVIDRA